MKVGVFGGCFCISSPPILLARIGTNQTKGENK
jgi:hypothetical protein